MLENYPVEFNEHNEHSVTILNRSPRKGILV